MAKYATGKSKIRFLLALAGRKKLPYVHLDIESAFIHDPYDDKDAVYVIKQPYFDGSYSKPYRVGCLLRNLYGSIKAEFIYPEGTAENLAKGGYQRSQHDPSLLFIIHSSNHFIFISVTLKDFLVVDTKPTFITDFEIHLKAK